MITPDQIAANLNRILEQQGSARRVEAQSYDPTERITSAGFVPFHGGDVYLTRPIDTRGGRWHRVVPAGAAIHARPYPGGSVRLVTASTGGVVLKDNAQEGVDFSVTPLVDIPAHTFVCDNCGKTHDLEITLPSDTPRTLLTTCAIYRGYDLGGGGKKNRGIKSLGWVMEQAQFFNDQYYSSGRYAEYKSEKMLGCPECAPAILKRKADHKDLLARQRAAKKAVS